MGTDIGIELKGCKSSEGISEVIRDRLYFVTFKNKTPEDDDTTHFFTEDDDELVHVSLATIARYFEKVKSKLSSPDIASKSLVHFSSGSQKRRGDAAVLVGAYCIVHLNMDPAEASEKLSNHTTTSLLDSLNALQKAIKFGFVNCEDFNMEEFEALEEISMNWVIPRKLLVFSGPHSRANEDYVPPKVYLRYFKESGVTTLVRLWHNKYDANPFVDCASLDHYDLRMEGTTPTEVVLNCFLEICEASEGTVVVHSRDFMGRSGTLVCALLVKHYRMTTGEATAWFRFTNFDRIMETQKKWLRKNEESLHSDGHDCRLKVFGTDAVYPHHVRGVCSHGKDQQNSRREVGSGEDEAGDEAESIVVNVKDVKV